MSLTNPNKPVTEARLQEFYHRIKSYLGFTEMPSEDIDEVISPLPSVQPRYHKYSTEEQIVGEWIDGSPIYEKTYSFTTSSTAGEAVNVNLANENMAKIIDVDAFVFWGASTKNYVPLIYADFKDFSNVSNMGNYYTSGSSSSNILTVKVYGSNFLGKDGYATIRYTKSE